MFFYENQMKNQQEEENQQTGEERRTDSAEDCGSVTVKSGDCAIRCITIIGQIEGHYLQPNNQKTTKYEHILPLLVSVEEDDSVGGLLLLLNTVGGDVEAGLAIAELIASMKKPTVSLVLGGGHSIGVPLAVSAKKSFIVPSATMTVHPVRISGTVVGAPQTYHYFSRMQNRITDFVTAHSGISKERFDTLLMQTDEIATDVGTILEGRQAVEEGLIDAVGGLSDAIDALRKLCQENKEQNAESSAT